jgi:hypothetical protein
MTGHLNARLSFVFAAPWQPLRSIIYVQKLNYLAAVVTLKRLVPKICFGHRYMASQVQYHLRYLSVFKAK